MKSTFAIFLVGILILSLLVISAPNVQAQSNTLTFTTIGDYGVNNEYEAAVASMVANWNPDLILGLGDDYYAEAGGVGSEKYDLSTGKYYCNFLKDITTTGTFCPTGQASVNRFFPALGDHDYTDGGMTNNLPTTYTDYFNLPGNGYTSSSNNERYYDFVSGPVHFFILNSIDEPGWEPDGADSSSAQAQWLQSQLGASTSIWNVVVIPSPPYSSGVIHGSEVHAQWPFAQWGADVVFSGDEHDYERVLRNGIVYFVNGLGGQWPYSFGTPIEGSAVRYNTSNGAQRVIATDTSMTFEFYSVENGGTLRDTYTITVPHNTATPTLPSNSTGWQNPSKQASSNNNGYEINPTDAFTDDGLFAMDMNSGTTTVASCIDSGKDKHKFYNYNISVPGGGTIQGIQVRLDANADSIAGTPKLCISLSWDGGSNWSSWKSTPNLTDAEETYLLGGVSDTWGHVWTSTELSNSNFQLRIADIASDNSRDFSLDWIAVNIVYSIGLTSTPTLTNTPLPPTATSTFTASPTYTLTSIPSDTSTLTSTATDTPTTTDTPTSTLTATNTLTNIPTQTASNTPTNTPTSTPADTPTFTVTATFTATNTVTTTQTPTNTSTYTATVTASNAPSSTPTLTPTVTYTPPTVSTSTPTITSTLAATATLIRSGDMDTTGVFRPSNGLLYLKNSNSRGFADVSINYGLARDYPVVGDWDGDGTATIGVYRNGKFLLRNSNTLGFADLVFAFGAPGDQPIAGDWNGDGVDTIGVYRPSTGQFLLRNSNSPGAPDKSFYLGNPGDVGIAGDWNGDGIDSTGVFRPSNGVIFLKNTNSSGVADVALHYGMAGDKPVTGDWDNDGIDTIGIYRNGTFYLRNSNTIGVADLTFALGINGDMPIAGNWDGKP
jgi:Calcineurin-like phosphoesterase